MAITLRNYKSPEDLRLQQTFWVQATRELPWFWKPTVSPALYSKSPQFDARSRCFAFEGERLVGYGSFTGHGDFVSLGYPWVLPGYEGELQEQLYEKVYSFAASPEYGGKTFAQRLRKQWTAQIAFFERHGFAVESTDPIYALDVRAASIKNLQSEYEVTCQPQFCWDDFHSLSQPRLSSEQLSMWKQYFQTVNFDFSVKATLQDKMMAYLGFAVREGTGFAELIAVAQGPGARGVLPSCLFSGVSQLRLGNARFLGAKATPANGMEEVLAQTGFEKVSEEILLFKSI